MAGTAEWFTPPEILQPVRAVLGEIDLDPATCADAQQLVQAKSFYTLEDDGLSQPWYGRVYLNAPYSRGVMDAFIHKLLVSSAVEAWIVLANNATETKWAQRLLVASRLVCFLSSRVDFIDAAGVPQTNNNRGQMVCYSGPDPDHFRFHFHERGMIR